ncbi:catalase [Streptosporangium brasiliense]|uniref:catalase n=1 Tax=Streptosporangium brasiliense TaxID=47480 RepID=A0ABT9RFG9_9ACTN|nr:catalase [Streptosporangium brasiliense]
MSSNGPQRGDGRPVLTNRQGHPVYDNQNQRTVGARGPATLENYQFLEKISHFDRERIPERVVHARGVTAYGYFEAYGKLGDEPVSRYTRAKLFQEAGKRTELAVRFSTVIGGRDSSEAARDPRGFAVKFYTEDGNWDLVGNNLAVFFIRDAIKFPDVIHALKPDPVTFRQEPNRIFDFMSQTPESMHMLVNLFSPRGIPADYRHMQGFGVNTYKWVNQQGETHLVKYHWMPKQGVRSMTAADAAAVQAQELGHATKDLHEAIDRGDFPEWELLVQIMTDEEHPELDFDPLDDTKVWPENDFPALPVGRMVLDRNVANNFAENEQISFGTGVLVDGLDFSDDKMLVGRTFSYSDTQRHRVGPNYLQLPVNQAKHAEVRTNQRDGQMTFYVDTEGESPHINYEPSLLGGLSEGHYPTHDEQGPVISGRLTRKRLPRTNDYAQAGQRYLLMEQWERDDLVLNLVTLLSQAERPVQERMVWHFLMVEDELGLRVGEGLGIGPGDVAHLEPLTSQELDEEERERLSKLGKNGPRQVSGLKMTHCVPDGRAQPAG